MILSVVCVHYCAIFTVVCVELFSYLVMSVTLPVVVCVAYCVILPVICVALLCDLTCGVRGIILSPYL